VATVAREHPARRALGLARRDLTIGTITGVLPAVVAGAALVPLVALAASWLFPRGVARLAEPDPGLRVDATALVLGTIGTALAGAFLLAVLSALAARAVGDAPIVRQRLTGRASGRPVIALGASFAADPAGAGRRSQGTAAATAAGITLGVAELISVAALEASRDHLDANPHLYGAPTELVRQSNGTFGVADAVEAALRTDGVTAVTRHVFYDDDESALEATGPAGAARVAPAAFEIDRGGALPPVVDGRLPQGSDEVAVGSATARDLGVGVGDTVRLDTVTGDRRDLRVSGVVVLWSTEDPEHAFVVQPESLPEIICAGGFEQVEQCDSVTVEVFASVADPAGREALLAAGFADVAAPANVARLAQVGSIPWYVAGFLGILGILGVLHAVATSRRRRRRDLAIVRALGLTGPRAAGALTWQALLFAVVGVSVGVVLGALAGRRLWTLIADDVGVVVVPRVPLIAVVACALGAIAACIVVSLGPRWSAARVPAAEALRSE